MSLKRVSAESDQDVSKKAPRFQKLSGREHILQRSDMYVGSTAPDSIERYIIDENLNLTLKEVKVAPAFLQIVEEALMNAADRVSVSQNGTTHDTTKISVEVNQNTISVFNNGDGIPCEFLEEFGVYAPELIFGHLRTSSNYNDNDQRLNVGRNGIGIKIANIFSQKMVLETVDSTRGSKYTQVFQNNMSLIGEPSIVNFKGSPFTRVSFSVDISRFGMPDDSFIPEDVVSILRRRCHEILLCSLNPVKVTFNGSVLASNTLERYLAMYGVDKHQISTASSSRWKFAVAFTPDVGKFRHFSFVNSTSTPQGGTHLQYVMDGFLKLLMSFLKKRFKSSKLKAAIVKDLLTVVVSAHVVNPTFSGQTKDMLTLPPKEFGSTFLVPESTVTKILRTTGIVDFLAEWLKNKEDRVLNDNDGKKSKSIKGIPKLHDAQLAGSRRSSETFLILTEGDSALTMALSATSIIGRERFGCFPLRGKLLNVRDASSQQVSTNAEITSLKKILGLQNGVKYDDDQSVKKLRYGGVILLTDADLDGSHIRGLLLNLFDTFWPDLLRVGFVKSISTPIVRATKGKEVLVFYNDFDYKSWKANSDISGYKIKYLKGLGSSTPAEAKEYFEDVFDKLVGYVCDEDARESMSLAFDKKRAGDRKKWLMEYRGENIIESSRRKVSVSDFVHKELIHFSQGDLLRSIPSVVDGLKLSQRKAICGSFMKGIEKVESKVAQLTGFVSDKMQYHHGESSMAGTIVGLAQDFVGSNNINFLLPKGQLGSRISNGADAASPRYTFVQLNPVTGNLFRKEDSPILQWTFDEGMRTEPVFYIPVISTLLVNGCRSIATGYSTYIPPFDPKDLVANVRRSLKKNPRSKITPFFRGFQGVVEDKNDGNFLCRGVYKVVGERVHISEIPIGTSIMSYKHFLDSLVEKKSISSYEEECTDSEVKFDVVLKSDFDCAAVESLLKLTSTLRTSNMHALDSRGNIKKYANVEEIEAEHFNVRWKAYSDRREHMISVLSYEFEMLDEKLRFFRAKISGDVVVENVSYADVIKSLESYGFKRMPSVFGGNACSFDHITSVKMFDVTKERVVGLEADLKRKVDQLQETRQSTVEDMWEGDLQKLERLII